MFELHPITAASIGSGQLTVANTGERFTAAKNGDQVTGGKVVMRALSVDCRDEDMTEISSHLNVKFDKLEHSAMYYRLDDMGSDSKESIMTTSEENLQNSRSLLLRPQTLPKQLSPCATKDKAFSSKIARPRKCKSRSCRLSNRCRHESITESSCLNDDLSQVNESCSSLSHFGMDNSNYVEDDNCAKRVGVRILNLSEVAETSHLALSTTSDKVPNHIVAVSTLGHDAMTTTSSVNCLDVEQLLTDSSWIEMSQFSKGTPTLSSFVDQLIIEDLENCHQSSNNTQIYVSNVLYKSDPHLEETSSEMTEDIWYSECSGQGDAGLPPVSRPAWLETEAFRNNGSEISCSANRSGTTVEDENKSDDHSKDLALINNDVSRSEISTISDDPSYDLALINNDVSNAEISTIDAQNTSISLNEKVSILYS